MLLLAEMTADHAFFYRPWQATFVGFKTAGYQLLLFGKGGLGRFLCLLTDHVVNLFIQISHFLLLLLQFLGQILLLALQLIQHGLLLFLVPLQVFLFFLAGVQRRFLVIPVRLEQCVLGVNLCLRVLDTAYLLFPEMGYLLHIPGTANQLGEVITTEHK